mmetsp:Transcript_131165/g.213521  ORF Transcript_131165/g.213521 Transcript_131165/m.213521 type:complete len:239 (+) Transcript_131165:442-1158(+)
MPGTLEIRIVLHRRLPITILLIIPIIRLLGLSINNALLLNPIIWLFVFWIINHGLVGPIIRFLVIRIRNLLWLQNLPILLDVTVIVLLFINVHPHCVVRPQDHPVQVSGPFRVTVLPVSKVGRLQDLLVLVGENHMRPLCVATLVWTKHDVVCSGIAEGLAAICHLRSNLDVSTTALDVLLVLCLILDDKIFPCVAEGVKRGGDVVESCVLGGHKALVLLLVSKELPSGQCEISCCPL